MSAVLKPTVEPAEREITNVITQCSPLEKVVPFVQTCVLKIDQPEIPNCTMFRPTYSEVWHVTVLDAIKEAIQYDTQTQAVLTALLFNDAPMVKALKLAAAKYWIGQHADDLDEMRSGKWED